MFGIVEPRVKRRTGGGISCSAERNEDSRFLFRGIVDFLARGGFVGLVMEMKKGPDDAIDLANEAVALADLGNHRAALKKYRPLLADLRKNGDDVNAVRLHLLTINCHAMLREVS